MDDIIYNIKITNPIDLSIIKLFEEHEKMHVGDIVRRIRKPYNVIVRHILDLKSQGILLKEEKDKGYIKLNKDYKIKK